MSLKRKRKRFSRNTNPMPYTYSKIVPGSVPDVVNTVKEAFAKSGFHPLFEIDVQAKMREKLSKDMGAYVMLGMCNAQFAYEALQNETELGTLLPCNVIVYEQQGSVHVAVVQPKALVAVTGNEHLSEMAQSVDDVLRKTLDTL